MQFKRVWRVALPVCFSAVVAGTIAIASAARNPSEPAPQQDVIRLESRINQLEQRLYGIDTSLRTLEQQSRMSSGNSRSANADDLARLLIEVQSLRRQLADHECALAKLDERTLTPARRKAGAGSGDPCRMNVDAPLRLPDSR